jgi:hypothetical protein
MLSYTFVKALEISLRLLCCCFRDARREWLQELRLCSTGGFFWRRQRLKKQAGSAQLLLHRRHRAAVIHWQLQALLFSQRRAAGLGALSLLLPGDVTCGIGHAAAARVLGVTLVIRRQSDVQRALVLLQAGAAAQQLARLRERAAHALQPLPQVRALCSSQGGYARQDSQTDGAFNPDSDYCPVGSCCLRRGDRAGDSTQHAQGHAKPTQAGGRATRRTSRSTAHALAPLISNAFWAARRTAVGLCLCGTEKWQEAQKACASMLSLTFSSSTCSAQRHTQ